MESSQHEDSKSSSQESDQQEQVNDDAGTGRSYGCVFCKRGFTTAQALGGHMNIHRKERAKIRQPTAPSVSNILDQEFVSSRFSSTISSHPPIYSPAAPEAQRSYHMYFPPSTSSPRRPASYHADELHTPNPQPLSLFEDNCCTNLSLQIVPTHMEHSEEEKKQEGEEDEPDLELRLGHDP